MRKLNQHSNASLDLIVLLNEQLDFYMICICIIAIIGSARIYLFGMISYDSVQPTSIGLGLADHTMQGRYRA